MARHTRSGQLRSVSRIEYARLTKICGWKAAAKTSMPGMQKRAAKTPAEMTSTMSSSIGSAASAWVRVRVGVRLGMGLGLGLGLG